MEKVIITQCDLIMDGKAHGVTLSDGRKCTAWNDKIDAGKLMQMYAARTPVLMDIQPYTSRAGKTGFNIKAIGNDTEVIIAGEPSAIPSMPDAASLSPKGPTATPMFSRDKSIIAQMCVKTGAEMLKSVNTSTFEEHELVELFCRFTEECAGMYKVILGRLE